MLQPQLTASGPIATTSERSDQTTVTGYLASVIIVSYNSRGYLEQCLSSLLTSVGANIEIILVDNASEDGSAAYVAEHYPAVKLVRNPQNTGFAAANNQAAKLAEGQYLVCLNPDTKVTPGWLEALLAPFTSEKVGLSTARILMLNRPDRVNTCGNAMHYSGLTVCRGLNQSAEDPELARPIEVPAVSGACFAIRRDLWQKLGGFDETFFTYLEDTDLSVRARLAGYTISYAPEAVIFHDYTSRFSNRKLYFLERNRWLLLLKNYQWRTLLLLLPALLLVELITWAYACKSGFGSIQAKLAAYAWFWQNRPEIQAKRSVTQALRQISDRQLLAALVWELDTRQLAGEKLGTLVGRLFNPLFKLNYLLANYLSK